MDARFMNRTPEITVLMPMRNAEPFVAEALESVLSQEGVDLEVLVIDDASTDRSRVIVERIGDPRVCLLSASASGVAHTLNTGIAAARGPILARCDADDRFAPGRLAWQLQWLRDHGEFGAVCGTFSTLTRAGRLLTAMDTGGQAAEITDELRRGETRTHFGTFAVRTRVVRGIGGCRPYFVTSSDIDLQLRIGHACRVGYEPRQCYGYRLHDDSITHTKQSAERLFFDGTAREFSRQRALLGEDDLDRGAAPRPPLAGDSQPLRAHRQIQDLLRGRSWKEHHQGRKWRAVMLGLRACAAGPASPSIWRSLAALVIKRPGRAPRPAADNARRTEGAAS
jgi:glycosyltransferase involved in cell wall biosynthesis